MKDGRTVRFIGGPLDGETRKVERVEKFLAIPVEMGFYEDEFGICHGVAGQYVYTLGMDAIVALAAKEES